MIKWSPRSICILSLPQQHSRNSPRVKFSLLMHFDMTQPTPSWKAQSFHKSDSAAELSKQSPAENLSHIHWSFIVLISASSSLTFSALSFFLPQWQRFESTPHRVEIACLVITASRFSNRDKTLLHSTSDSFVYCCFIWRRCSNSGWVATTMPKTFPSSFYCWR